MQMCTIKRLRNYYTNGCRRMNSYGSKINDTLLASNEEERYISVSLIFEIDRIEDVKKFKELFGISLEVLCKL